MKYYQKLVILFRLYFLRSFFPAIFCFAILFNNDVKSQVENTHTKSLNLSVNAFLNQPSIIDYKFSSVPFKGLNFGASLLIKFRKNKIEHQLHALYTAGNIKPKNFPDNISNERMINLDYFNLYTVAGYDDALLQFKAGGALQLLYAERIFTGFINTNRAFETILSLGGVAEINYHFTNRLDGYTLSNRTIIPFIFSYSQSPFSANAEEGLNGSKGIGFFLHYNQFSIIPKIFRIKNSFAIEKKLTDKHLISITYNWDYYRIKTSRAIVQGSHQAGISYTYNF